MITIPTISEIKARILADIESTTSRTNPTSQKRLIRLIAAGQAGVSYLLYHAIKWVYSQIFPQKSDEEALNWAGSIVNIYRVDAVQTEVYCTVAGTTGEYVQSGWAFTADNGAIYEVQAIVEIIAGVATDVVLECLTAGDIGNLENGAELNDTASHSVIDGIAIVTSTKTSGADQESLESFRDRVVFRYKRRLTGGSPADYYFWGISEPNFTWIGIYSDISIPNTLHIYGKVDNQTDGVPTGGQLTELEYALTYGNDGLKSRKPTGAVLSMHPITIATFDINIVTQDCDADVKALIEADVIAFLPTLEPYQIGVSITRHDTLTSGNISNVADSIAQKYGGVVVSVEITEVFTGSVVQNYTLIGGEFAKVRNITIT